MDVLSSVSEAIATDGFRRLKHCGANRDRRTSGPWDAVLRRALRGALPLFLALAPSAPARAQAIDARTSTPTRAAADATAYLRAGSSRVLIGAAAGLVIGAGTTYLIVHSGGSSSLCDRDRNQDALNSTECFGLVALGAAAGAGIGALIGHLLRGDDADRRFAPAPPLRVLPLPGRRPGVLLDVTLRPLIRSAPAR